MSKVKVLNAYNAENLFPAFNFEAVTKCVEFKSTIYYRISYKNVAILIFFGNECRLNSDVHYRYSFVRNSVRLFAFVYDCQLSDQGYRP